MSCTLSPNWQNEMNGLHWRTQNMLFCCVGQFFVGKTLRTVLEVEVFTFFLIKLIFSLAGAQDPWELSTTITCVTLAMIVTIKFGTLQPHSTSCCALALSSGPKVQLTSTSSLCKFWKNKTKQNKTKQNKKDENVWLNQENLATWVYRFT